MMLALLRTNPQAFNLDNVNALKTGAVLRIPAASEVRDDKAQALAEVARQRGLWDEYRQSISAAVRAQPGGAAAQPVQAPVAKAAPESATAMDKAATASGQAENAVLKLVGSGTKGSTTGGPSLAADLQALRDDLSMAQEEAETAKLENKELNSRLNELGGFVENMKRLVELREDQLAALQNKLVEAEKAADAAKTPATDSAPVTAAMPVAAPAPEMAAKPDPAPKVEATPVVPEQVKAAPTPAVATPPKSIPEPRSLLDELQELLPVPLWTVLAGLGALLLGFSGMRMARARKGAVAAVDDRAAPGIDPGGSLIDQYAQTELPAASVTDDDETQLPAAPSAAAETQIDADKTVFAPGDTATSRTNIAEEDPLAEVNVYLAYERFDQAEQLVRDAIETYPDRPEYQLKLLEVFYAEKDVISFEPAAEQLQATVGADHEFMRQAQVWWGELGTGRALFVAGTAAIAIAGTDDAAEDDLFDVTTAQSDRQTGVDFDLDFEGSLGEESAGGGDLDFDLGAADEGPLDFDLAGFADDDGAAADSGPATRAIAAVAVAGAAAGAVDRFRSWRWDDFRRATA